METKELNETEKRELVFKKIKELAENNVDVIGLVFEEISNLRTEIDKLSGRIEWLEETIRCH